MAQYSIEMCEIKYHVKLPIFITRQWIRHRTANVNEYSARYSILDKEFYLPSQQNLAAQSTSNDKVKEMFWKENRQRKFETFKSDAERTCDNYETMLNEDLMDQLLTKIKGLERTCKNNLTLNTYAVVLEN